MRLRKIKEADLELIMKWRMSEEVTKYMYTDPILTIDSQKKWFDDIGCRNNEYYWVIEYDGVPVGVVSINCIDYKNRKCSWGYYIGDTRFRGKGIAKNVELNIYNFVFSELNLNKLISEVLSSNEKVIKIHEKFGSVTEGVLKDHIYKNGQYLDVVTMGITKKRWEKFRNKFLYEKINIEV